MHAYNYGLPAITFCLTTKKKEDIGSTTHTSRSYLAIAYVTH